jgi:hypothetical protein
MGSWDLAEFEDFAVRCLRFHSGVCVFVIYIYIYIYIGFAILWYFYKMVIILFMFTGYREVYGNLDLLL